MQIGQVIRKYRKENNLTQEEMAGRLGVTAPAVNKWENGNSYPDILLLAPIARLLHISLDTLLSYQEDLSDAEIKNIVQEMDRYLKNERYEEVFQWAKEIIETYPNCKMLIWQLATILDAQRLLQSVSDVEKYDTYIINCYERVLESEDEKMRVCAADSLFGYYTRKEQYEKAESFLRYYSEQNLERKRKQAVIYSKTGRIQEAYKAYEEILFSDYQMLSMVFNSIYMLAMQDDNLNKAREMVKKQQELARLFEMGTYYEVSCQLELALKEKDTDAVLEIVQKMLESVEKIGSFIDAELYEHMTFKKTDATFVKEVRENLIKQFQKDEAFDFLKYDARWKNILEDVL